MRENLKEWLPSAVKKIDFGATAAPGVSVEGIGQVVFQLINVEEGGAPATISCAPILSAFGTKLENLALAHTRRFSNPDLRSWENLGAGGVVSEVVSWTG